MARSITYWYDLMATEKSSFSSLNVYQPLVDSSQDLLSDLTSTSRVARWRLSLWVVATAHYVLDVLFDNYRAEIEDKIRRAIPGTAGWWQQKMFDFQYDTITPQIVTLVDLVPTYTVVDASKRIITRCSVRSDINKNVIIKIAKGTTSPVPLSTLELKN